MTSMRKRYLRLAAIVFTLAYLGAIGTAAFRIVTRSSALSISAENEFKELVERANAAAGLGFLGEPFRDSVLRSLEKSSSLAAVIITGPTGPEYAVERSAGYLVEENGLPRFASRIEIAKEPLFSPLRVADARNATIAAARFQAIPSELVVILRDSLLLSLVPLAAALLILLFSSSAAEPVIPAEETRQPDSSAPLTTNSGLTEEFEIPDIAPDVAAEETIVAPPLLTKEEPEPEKPSGLYGPDGFLGWEAYLEERLEAELRRAASFEQDLVLLAAEIDAEGSHERAAFDAFAEELVSFFSFRDLSFKRGKNGAVVILPNIDLDQGLLLTEEFMAKRKDRGENVEIGLSARAGRLVDSARLLTEAASALSRARKNGNFQIMAFKPDPERYRSFVAANT